MTTLERRLVVLQWITVTTLLLNLLTLSSLFGVVTTLIDVAAR